MNDIPEMRDVDAAAFVHIRVAAAPVVIRGLVGDWPIVAAARESDAACAAYLRSMATDKSAAFMRAAPDVEGRLHYGDAIGTRNFTQDNTTISAYLDALAAEAKKDQPDALALQGLPAPGYLEGFAEANALSLLPPQIPPRLWIGNAAKVAIHHDPSENIACVAAGRRRFTLFPPDQVGNLYMGPFDPTPAGVQVSMAHVTAPDLQRFPRFAEALAAARVAELEPGDAIYIPYHWYHHVEAHDRFNVLVNYWWDARRLDTGSPWDALMHALMSLRTLPPDQRRAWQAMFAHYVFMAHGEPGAHLPPEHRGILDATSPRAVAQMRAALIDKLQKR